MTSHTYIYIEIGRALVFLQHQCALVLWNIITLKFVEIRYQGISFKETELRDHESDAFCRL
jgi:hypothetical protein